MSVLFFYLLQMEEQSLKCNSRLKQVYNIDYLSKFLRYRMGKSYRPWMSNSGPFRKKIFSSSSWNRGWESEQIRSRFSTIKERIMTATLLRPKTRYHECGTISRQIFKVFASLQERHTVPREITRCTEILPQPECSIPQ